MFYKMYLLLLPVVNGFHITRIEKKLIELKGNNLDFIFILLLLQLTFSCNNLISLKKMQEMTKSVRDNEVKI